MEYWSGKFITSLKENEVFVAGTNPVGRHGAGAAKAGTKFGLIFGKGRGLMGSAYGLITKNLEGNENFLEKETGIIYDKTGFKSLSPEMIRQNIDELYICARQNIDKKFLITYQYETYPNGTPKKSLNGYTSQEILEMFVRKDIPANIVFHDSYKSHLEKVLANIQESSQDVNQQLATENKPQQYTFFFHLTSPFSNFHPAKFVYKEFTFISNEQFMMFSKAKNFKDEETANKILALNNSPLAKDLIEGKLSRLDIVNDKNMAAQWNQLMISIKKLGREVKNYDEKFWSVKRKSVVLFGAREKFKQNDDLKHILINTGETLMIEASKYDKLSTMISIIQKIKQEFNEEENKNKKIKP